MKANLSFGRKAASAGHYAVATADLVLELDAEGRTLPIKVSYPTSGEAHPLLIFSHGLLGSKDGYQVLVRYLVSHGYVVIAPTHTDSAVYRKPKLSELKDMTPLFVDWHRRPRDISFILDNLSLIEAQIVPLAGRIDHSKIAMAGHSFGSHTGFLLAGVSLAKYQNEPGRVRPFFDERLKAFLLISPQGPGLALTHDSAFDADSFAALRQPMMLITGTQDNFKRGQDYLWRSEPFHLMPPGAKHLMVIDGGCHGFGGIAGTRFPGAGPDNSEHVEWVKLSTLTFFDTYLKNCQEAAQFLLDGDLAELSSALNITHR